MGRYPSIEPPIAEYPIPGFRLQRIDMKVRNKDISASHGVGDTDLGSLTLTVNGVTVQSRPCSTTVP
uniref:Uncharacterized protein n=1 Tax=Rhizobium leguminosarum TaxID=384 RepID=A0A154I999_RHILE|nr:hypothetical protein A4A59_32690 [Rhizobium leguminosarum]